MKKIYYSTVLIILSLSFFLTGCKKKEQNYIKIGLLHSLTGTMAISETPVRDSELLAIKEINEAGGVLGKKIIAVEEDGESDPYTFGQKARKLITESNVVAIFGCWTSASRKAVKPVVEEYFNLLWYPVQYEGMEASPNIMYMGASPNQQVVPAVDYCAQTFGKRMFLVGSDYIFPRTANRIIKAQLAQMNGECVGEAYVPMGSVDFSEVIDDIIREKPDVIINSINGDSNIEFFKQLSEAGISARFEEGFPCLNTL